jgi:biotin operon repressor
MMENEKSRSGAGTLERERETMFPNRNTDNRLNCTMQSVDVQDPILDYLAHGWENAHTAKEIAAMMGCTTREVTKAVQNARRHGAPICSNPGYPPGYYLPAEREELERCVRQLHHRGNEISLTLAALENALHGLDTMEGQMEMMEVE